MALEEVAKCELTLSAWSLPEQSGISSFAPHVPIGIHRISDRSILFWPYHVCGALITITPTNQREQHQGGCKGEARLWGLGAFHVVKEKETADGNAGYRKRIGVFKRSVALEAETEIELRWIEYHLIR